MVSLLLMRRRPLCCCDGVVDLVALALLSLLMRRPLALFNVDGNGTTGNDIDGNCDGATNVNDDGDGTANDNVNNNDCDGQ